MQAPTSSEGAPHVLLLDAVDLRVPPLRALGPAQTPSPGPSRAAEDSDDDEADGGWVLVDGEGRAAGRIADGHRSGGSAALRLLPDPAAAERVFCVASGVAWALTLPWLPALAALLAQGATASSVQDSGFGTGLGHQVGADAAMAAGARRAAGPRCGSSFRRTCSHTPVPHCVRRPQMR